MQRSVASISIRELVCRYECQTRPAPVSVCFCDRCCCCEDLERRALFSLRDRGGAISRPIRRKAKDGACEFLNAASFRRYRLERLTGMIAGMNGLCE